MRKISIFPYISYNHPMIFPLFPIFPCPFSYPIGSMYGIYANIWGILMVNVTIYGIHGSYGYDFPTLCWWYWSTAQLRAADVRQIHEGAQGPGVAVQGAVVHRGPAWRRRRKGHRSKGSLGGLGSLQIGGIHMDLYEFIWIYTYIYIYIYMYIYICICIYIYIYIFMEL